MIFKIKKFTKDSELIALFPSNTIGKSVYSHQGLTYGGILVKSDMKFTQYLELFENILNYYFEKSFEKFKKKHGLNESKEMPTSTLEENQISDLDDPEEKTSIN